MSAQARRGQRFRILFYNHTGLMSGAERVLLTTLHDLDPSQFETVVACPPDGELTSLVQAQGSETVAVGALQARFTSNPIRLFQHLKSFASVIAGFRASVKRADPDAIHANSVRAGLVATIAMLGTRMPIIWHVHDNLPPHPISSAIRMVAFVSRRTRLLSVSKATAKAFCGRLPFGERSSVLYNGVELRRYPLKTDAEFAFREELGVQQDEFLLCAVGIINRRKGQMGLLDAFALVVQQIPNAHLAIVGGAIFNRDDLYLEQLKQQADRLGIQTRVHFTGPRKDIPAVLRAADLLVLNAVTEPFGLVLVEAMSSGTPVLATRVGGIPEIVTDNRTGFLVPPADPHALAARIVEVYKDPDARRQVVESALIEVCPRFSKERYAAGFAAFYREKVINATKQADSAPTHPGQHEEATANHQPRIAVFHDNFAQNGGAERVAEELHIALRTMDPGTQMMSTLTAEERLSPYLRAAGIRNTWMQRLPARAKLFRAYFFLYPFAIDRANLATYDVVVTSCFGYAKGVRRRPGALHVCYSHTPMRWIWRAEDYLSRERNGKLKALLLAAPLHWLKWWELRAATRPDLYIANSTVVAERLKFAFGVDATVIHPPIETARFAPEPGTEIKGPEDFYLVLSRLVPYKRFDLAVEACTTTGRRLVVIGDGPDRARLEAMAGPTVTFLGRAPNDVVNDHAQRCRALLFPGEEDFGMTPLEINAAGRPVVAYHAGGAKDTIVNGLNGVFFEEPTAGSMIDAMERLEHQSWDAQAIQRHAARFDVKVFRRKILEFVTQAMRNQAAATS